MNTTINQHPGPSASLSDPWLDCGSPRELLAMHYRAVSALDALQLLQMLLGVLELRNKNGELDQTNRAWATTIAERLTAYGVDFPDLGDPAVLRTLGKRIAAVV